MTAAYTSTRPSTLCSWCELCQPLTLSFVPSPCCPPRQDSPLYAPQFFKAKMVLVDPGKRWGYCRSPPGREGSSSSLCSASREKITIKDSNTFCTDGFPCLVVPQYWRWASLGLTAVVLTWLCETPRDIPSPGRWKGNLLCPSTGKQAQIPRAVIYADTPPTPVGSHRLPFTTWLVPFVLPSLSIADGNKLWSRTWVPKVIQ